MNFPVKNAALSSVFLAWLGETNIGLAWGFSIHTKGVSVQLLESRFHKKRKSTDTETLESNCTDKSCMLSESQRGP